MRKAAEIIEIPATVTERGQTTVPAAIRKMLDLDGHGRIVFRGLADGTVVIAKRRVVELHQDPVIDRFLDFLATDMSARPQMIRPVQCDVIDRARALVDSVEVDLDAALPDEEA